MFDPRFLIPFNQELLVPAQSVAVFNAARDTGLEELGHEILIEQDNANDFAMLQAREMNVVPRIENGGSFDRALIFITKHSGSNKAMIGRAFSMVKEGGDILIEGAKNEGIDSLIRGLKALGIAPNVEAKSHGKIVWFTRIAASVGAIGEWEKSDLPSVNNDGYHVRPGIFSAVGIDRGTAFLLENLNMPIKGVVADFGSGYGVISKEILDRHATIASMDMYEISALATDCAKQNVTDPRAHIHWLSVDKAAKAHFDVIISNPPFHLGRKGDPEIGMAFIDAAAKSLRAKGAFYMVANKHLPYEHRLRSRFGNVDIISESPAFKLFKASRPDSKGL